MATRVLILSWEYPPIVEGGLARHVRKLSEQLVRDGLEVHVLSRGGGRLAAEEDRHGVIVHRVREPEFPRDDLDAFVRWVDAMNEDMRAAGAALGERLDFDLVHSHDWLVAAAAQKLARRFRSPWLVTVHATEHGRHQGWVSKHPQKHIHGVERRMVHRADGVITCSHYMRGHVADVFGIEESRISVIPNGIDPEDLQPVADLPRLRATYAAPDERLVLLVGRLVYEKGFHLALDALPGVIERLGNVRAAALALPDRRPHGRPVAVRAHRPARGGARRRAGGAALPCPRLGLAGADDGARALGCGAARAAGRRGQPARPSENECGAEASQAVPARRSAPMPGRSAVSLAIGRYWGFRVVRWPVSQAWRAKRAAGHAELRPLSSSDLGAFSTTRLQAGPHNNLLRNYS